MKLTFGHFRSTTVEVINRQQKVEYKVLSGSANKKEVRAALGNVYRDTYSYCFTGYYSDRKPAIKRLEGEIKNLEEKVKEMKFALKVTKKKHWSEVINKDNNNE
jgi:hypothetical protein